MVRAYSMMGFGPIGIQCGGGSGISQDMPLTLGYRVYSDVGGSCETFGSGGNCDIDRKLDEYAPKFNRALVSNPAYPYRDICRVTTDRGQIGTSPSNLNPVTQLGFSDLDRSRPPLTIHEAARRGDIPAMQRMLEVGWLEQMRIKVAGNLKPIDAVDDFDYSPLQWALAYREFDAAKWLLGKGARLSEEQCPNDQATLALALKAGGEDIAETIYRKMPQPGRWKQWDAYMVAAAAEGGAARFLKRMLNAPHDDRDLKADLSAYSPAVQQVITSQREALCWQGPFPANMRVDVVDGYQGGDDPLTPNTFDPGITNITVPKSDRPRILVLKAHDSLEWVIRAQPGANIAGIFVFGTEPADVTVTGSSPRIMNQSRGRWCPSAFPAKREGDWDDAVLLALRLTGRKSVDSIHRGYGLDDFTL